MSHKTPLALLIVVTFLIGADYLAAQWTAPSVLPPGNNVAAPVNVSANPQTKPGLLGVNELITNALMVGRADVPTATTDVAVAGSVAASAYCDANGQNCFTATSTGLGGGVGDDDTITVGGRCFEPAWAVTCNWNWSGDGNDNSTYIRPMTGTASNVCASVNRSYQYHTIVLAECSTPVYRWVLGAYSCNAPWAFSCSTTYGRNVRTVECRDQYGSIVADSNCPAPKPATDGGACSRYGGGSDC